MNPPQVVSSGCIARPEACDGQVDECAIAGVGPLRTPLVMESAVGPRDHSSRHNGTMLARSLKPLASSERNRGNVNVFFENTTCMKVHQSINETLNSNNNTNDSNNKNNNITRCAERMQSGVVGGSKVIATELDMPVAVHTHIRHKNKMCEKQAVRMTCLSGSRLLRV